MTAPVVMAAHAWRTNAEMIADVARLGYIGPHVLDPTYGLGLWWEKYHPARLTAHDINPKRDPTGVGHDFTALRYEPGSFDTIAFDPPYKLNGTPTVVVDARYGVHEPTRWQDRHALITAGVIHLAPMVAPGGTFLLKCQDQVVSGHVRWQTREFAHAAECSGLRLVDRFDMLGHGRPQPTGRRQVHAYGRPSTLLVFAGPK